MKTMVLYSLGVNRSMKTVVLYSLGVKPLDENNGFI